MFNFSNSALNGVNLIVIITLPDTVATGDREQCHRDNYVTMTSQEGHIASMITEETGYGSAGCPWKIRVLPGQRINLTVFDFNRPWPFTNSQTFARSDTAEGCPISAVIDDESETKHIQLCDAGDRQRHLYLSSSNELSVHFAIRTMTTKHYYVMVHYKGKILTVIPLLIYGLLSWSPLNIFDGFMVRHLMLCHVCIVNIIAYMYNIGLICKVVI